MKRKPKENMTANDLYNRWEEFLDPEKLRGKLITSALFIVSYELLEDSIKGRIKDFFSFGFNETGDLISPNY